MTAEVTAEVTTNGVVPEVVGHPMIGVGKNAEMIAEKIVVLVMKIEEMIAETIVDHLVEMIVEEVTMIVVEVLGKRAQDLGEIAKSVKTKNGLQEEMNQHQDQIVLIGVIAIADHHQETKTMEEVGVVVAAAVVVLIAGMIVGMIAETIVEWTDETIAVMIEKMIAVGIIGDPDHLEVVIAEEIVEVIAEVIAEVIVEAQENPPEGMIVVVGSVKVEIVVSEAVIEEVIVEVIVGVIVEQMIGDLVLVVYHLHETIGENVENPEMILHHLNVSKEVISNKMAEMDGLLSNDKCNFL